MTENEEIKKVINGLNFLKEKLYNGIYADRLDCIDSAIYALKEIQRYREIGASPERITELILEGSAAKRILGHYQKIGTVEECRKAVEKQKAKKPVCKPKPYNESVGFNEEWFCPSCGAYIGYFYEGMDEPEQMEYCNECGQHIARDWSDESEDE